MEQILLIRRARPGPRGTDRRHSRSVSWSTYRGSGIINLSTGAVAMVGVCLLVPEHRILRVLPADPAGLPRGTSRHWRVGSSRNSPCSSLCALLPAGQARGIPRHPAHAAGHDARWSSEPNPQQAPTSFRPPPSTSWGSVLPPTGFLLTGLIIVMALAHRRPVPVDPLRARHPRGLENEQAALLAGLSPDGVSLANTLLSTLVARAARVLAAPIIQIDSVTLPLQVVPALAAALFAGFTSLWIACSAGILIGVLRSRSCTTSPRRAGSRPTTATPCRACSNWLSSV